MMNKANLLYTDTNMKTFLFSEWVHGGSPMEAQEAGLGSSQHQRFFKIIPRTKGHQDHHAAHELLCGSLCFGKCCLPLKDEVQGWLNVVLCPNYCVP
uniref:Vomeronasal 1 receptor 41 n=1 Tax=Mus musculus TaxID=10090 RepID=A0A2I3BPT8_MOUSE